MCVAQARAYDAGGNMSVVNRELALYVGAPEFRAVEGGVLHSGSALLAEPCPGRWLVGAVGAANAISANASADGGSADSDGSADGAGWGCAPGLDDASLEGSPPGSSWSSLHLACRGGHYWACCPVGYLEPMCSVCDVKAGPSSHTMSHSDNFLL